MESLGEAGVERRIAKRKVELARIDLADVREQVGLESGVAREELAKSLEQGFNRKSGESRRRESHDADPPWGEDSVLRLSLA